MSCYHTKTSHDLVIHAYTADDTLNTVSPHISASSSHTSSAQNTSNLKRISPLKRRFAWIYALAAVCIATATITTITTTSASAAVPLNIKHEQYPPENLAELSCSQNYQNPICEQLKYNNNGEYSLTMHSVLKFLPLWRWGDISDIYIDTYANNSGNFVTQGIDGMINGLIYIMIRIPLMLATFTWRAISSLTELTLSPDIFTGMFYTISNHAPQFWKGKLLHGVLPLIFLGFVIAVILGIWKVIAKPIYQGGSTSWYKSITQIALPWFWLTLAFISLTATFSDSNHFLSPIKLLQNGYEITGNFTQPIFKATTNMESSNRKIYGTCDVYNRALEKLYRKYVTGVIDKPQGKYTKLKGYTIIDEEGNTIIDEEGNITTTESPDYQEIEETPINGKNIESIRKEIPILISRMWEDSYYRSIGMAQFGDKLAARRGTCYLLEWKADTTAAQQQAVIDTTAAGDGIKIYGAKKGRPWDEKQYELAYQRFNPGFNSDAMRSLMVLVSACDFTGSTASSTNSQSYKLEEITKEKIKKEGEGGGTPTLDPSWEDLQGNNSNQKLTANTCKHYGDAASKCGGKGTDCWNQVKHKTGAQGSPEYVSGTGLHAQSIIAQANITTKQIHTRNMGMSNKYQRSTSVVEKMAGLNQQDVLPHAILAFITAGLFLYSLAGLAIGTIIAQIVLVMILLFLPLLFFLMALPSKSTSTLAKKVGRMGLIGLVSYSIFFVLIVIMMTIINIFNTITEDLFHDNDMIRIVLIALIPLIAMTLINMVIKMMGVKINLTSIKGMAEFTSGMASAGLSLDDTTVYGKNFAAFSKKAAQTTGQATKGTAHNSYKFLRAPDRTVRKTAVKMAETAGSFSGTAQGIQAVGGIGNYLSPTAALGRSYKNAQKRAKEGAEGSRKNDEQKEKESNEWKSKFRAGDVQKGVEEALKNSPGGMGGAGGGVGAGGTPEFDDKAERRMAAAVEQGVRAAMDRSRSDTFANMIRDLEARHQGVENEIGNQQQRWNDKEKEGKHESAMYNAYNQQCNIEFDKWDKANTASAAQNSLLNDHLRPRKQNKETEIQNLEKGVGVSKDKEDPGHVNYAEYRGLRTKIQSLEKNEHRSLGENIELTKLKFAMSLNPVAQEIETASKELAEIRKEIEEAEEAKAAADQVAVDSSNSYSEQDTLRRESNQKLQGIGAEMSQIRGNIRDLKLGRDHLDIELQTLRNQATRAHAQGGIYFDPDDPVWQNPEPQP